MKALVGAFNQEKALVGAFSVIVQPVVEPMEHYTALFKALAWWEDEVENPDLSLDLDTTPGRRKILFEDRIRRRRASLESSVRRVTTIPASDWSTLSHVIQILFCYWSYRSSTCTSTPKSQGGGIGGKLRSSIGSSSRSGHILIPDWSNK